MNTVTKQIDIFLNKDPEPSFEKLDDLQYSTSSEDVTNYSRFKTLESKYSEVFRLAREFAGTKKGFGCHASGVLITPFPVSSVLPVRVHEGKLITLNTGTQLEDLNFIKFDILGLKTLDVIDKTIKKIDKNMKITDFYKFVKTQMKNDDIYKQLRDKNTDCVFQLESGMFKGLCNEIGISSFNDIVATTSIGRPGPLSAGLNKTYANRKNGNETVVDPLPGLNDILIDTFGCIIYQEAIMQIAKKVAKVNDNQADSLFRKAVSKKKADLFAICTRVFVYGKKNCEPPKGNDNTKGIFYDPDAKYGEEILGGINNGYEEKALLKFMEDLKGYASYLFNRSHAAAYSLITLCTAYLKKYYPVEYYASYLSVKPDEIEKMLTLLHTEKIELHTPDINTSQIDYSVIEGKKKQILMGLCSIASFGNNAMDYIITNRPFASSEDILNIEKGFLDKTALTNLISCGALNSFETNRYKLINEMFKIRKIKDDLYVETQFNINSVRELESNSLSIAVTYPSVWTTAVVGKLSQFNIVITDVFEMTDKNNNLMAKIKVDINGQIIDSVAFARCYCNNHDKLKVGSSLKIKGKKNDKGSLEITSICKPEPETISISI